MAIFRVPINITFPGAGSPGANIWHIRTLDPNITTELSQANALIGYIRTFYNNLVSYLPATTALTLGTVTDIEDEREIVPTFSTVTGTGTGSMMQALALVVTWRTEIAARRGRGRTFFGPLATATVEADGTIAPTFLSTARTSAASLVTSSQAYLNGAIGVWGYRDAKLPGVANVRNPADPKVFRDVKGYQVRDLFGVLRSRRD